MRLPLLLVATGFALSGCASPDPGRDLEVTDIETYWVVDSSIGETNYLAPLVRLRLRNKGREPQRSIQATAVFRRKGEEGQTWGSGWQQVTRAEAPLEAGRDALVELRSDARYHSTADPRSMFDHALFRDASVEVFVRVGSSGWVKVVAASPVERRIGSRNAEVLAP